MSFLPKLFRRTPGRDQWPEICADIAKGSTEARRIFWGYCLEALDSDLIHQVFDPEIKQKSSTREADEAMMGFQLLNIDWLIDEQRYIKSQDARAFGKTLINHMCGPLSQNPIQFSGKYNQIVNEKGGGQLYTVFMLDVLDHILGDRTKAGIPSVLLVRLVPIIQAETQLSVAAAFHDESRAGELIHAYDKTLKNVREHIFEKTEPPGF